MSSTSLKTSDECHSYRVENSFIFKWVARNFHGQLATDGEIIPSKKLEFNYGPDAKFIGKLHLEDRNSIFILKSINLDEWGVKAKLTFYNFQENFNEVNVILNKDSNQAITRLGRYDVSKICEEGYKIKMSITYASYTVEGPPSCDHVVFNDEVTDNANHSCSIEKTFTYKWIIHNFDCKNVQKGEILPSAKLEFGFGSEAKFCGKLYLHGGDCTQRQCILDLKSTTLNKWKVRVALLLSDEVESCCVTLSEESNKAMWNLFGIFSKECLLPTDHPYKQFTITCLMNYEEQEHSSFSAVKDHDLAELYETKIDWDVTFVVAGHEVLAHKSILTDRSKVFAAMLGQEMEKSNEIIISDVDVEVFQEMLRFTYTGKVDKLTLELLAASDKYDLPELKTICENELKQKVAKENAAETLLMADICNVPKLKEHTIIYIKKNLAAVTKTEGWHKLVNKHCNLFAEIWK